MRGGEKKQMKGVEDIKIERNGSDFLYIFNLFQFGVVEMLSERRRSRKDMTMGGNWSHNLN